jgi:hypothetical protein
MSLQESNTDNLKSFKQIYHVVKSFNNVPFMEHHHFPCGVQAEVDWYKNDVKIEAERSRYEKENGLFRYSLQFCQNQIFLPFFV